MPTYEKAKIRLSQAHKELLYSVVVGNNRRYQTYNNYFNPLMPKVFQKTRIKLVSVLTDAGH